jgi:hypothetical protein
MKAMYAALVIFGLFNLYHHATELRAAYAGSAHARSFNYAAATETERRAFLEHVAKSTADAMRPKKYTDPLKTRSVLGAFDHDTKTIRITQIVGVDLLTVEERHFLEKTLFEKNCQIVTSSLSELGVSIELDAKTELRQQFYRVFLSQKTCASYVENAQLKDL